MPNIKTLEQSIHDWERFYKIKVMFMHPGQKNRKLSKEGFANFIRKQTIQLTVDHYSLKPEYRKDVI